MATEAILTRKTKKDGTVEYEVTTNADFDALYDASSKEVQKSNSIANIKVGYRSRVKALAKQGFKGKALDTEIAGWRPGVASPRGAVDIEAAYMANYRGMTPEEKKAEIKKLQAM